MKRFKKEPHDKMRLFYCRVDNLYFIAGYYRCGDNLSCSEVPGFLFDYSLSHDKISGVDHVP